MYICKSEKAATITQLELIDYFSEGRKIVFDMDNERESKKATRILKPKGLIKKRRKSKKKKAQIQTTIGDLFGIKPLKKNEKKFELSTKSLVKTSKIKGKTDDTNNINRKKSQKKRIKKKVLSKKIDSIPDPISEPTPEPTSEPTPEPTSESTQEPIPELIPEFIPEFIPEPIPEPKLKSISELGPENNIIVDSDSPSSEILHLVDYDTITQFGDDGNIEITCPFCKDIIYFHYDDIDRKSIRNTRVCSCDAIARISSRMFNKKIFSDFGLVQKHEKLIKKVENQFQDEYGNPVFTFAFQNQI